MILYNDDDLLMGSSCWCSFRTNVATADDNAAVLTPSKDWCLVRILFTLLVVLREGVEWAIAFGQFPPENF
jgi:hypothetical protein